VLKLYPPSQPLSAPFHDTLAAANALVAILSARVGGGASLEDLETTIAEEGRKVLRAAMQDALDLGASQEAPPAEVVGADGVGRTHRRDVALAHRTLFGSVVVRGVAFSGRGYKRLIPRAARLQMNPGMYSAALRQRMCRTVVDSSFDAAVDEVARQTSSGVPKRQAEEVVRDATKDFDTFYAERAGVVPASGHLLVLSMDGKGVVMTPSGLRDATRARAAQGRSRRHLGGGEKTDRKRMAEVAAVYDIAPDVRTVEELMAGGASKRRRPKPNHKRVWASLSHSLAVVVDQAFAEAARRDPERRHVWVVLVDGNRDQLRAIRAASAKYGVKPTITLDVVHVIEYLWRAARTIHGDTGKAGEAWVEQCLQLVLTGRTSQVAASLRGMARSKKRTASARTVLGKVARYLGGYRQLMTYAANLKAGLPIATGVIEGACRHLIADRMDRTGARWGLDTAEAVLRLRALRSSGDWDAYWRHHALCELQRNHLMNYADHELADLRMAA